MNGNDLISYAEPLQDMSNKEVADLGHVHYSTGRRWREKGEIDAIEDARRILRRAERVNPALALAIKRRILDDPCYLPADREPLECCEDALITEAILGDGEVAELLRALIEARHPRSLSGRRLHPQEKTIIGRVLDRVLARVLRFQRLLQNA